MSHRTDNKHSPQNAKYDDLKSDALSDEQSYVIITHWGTLLYADSETGLLVGQAPNARDTLLTFRFLDDGSFVPNIQQELSCNDILCRDYFTSNLKIQTDIFRRCVTFSLGEKYFAALDDGRISIEHTWVGTWETFWLLPVRELHDLLDRNKFRNKIILPTIREVVCPQTTIPRLIHQTYPSSILPLGFHCNVGAIRAKNVGYEYKLWTDRDVLDFIYQEYGYEILSAYLSINPRYGACRADLFRYLCIYHYGGVYLDIKSDCGIPLSDLIRPDDEYLLQQSGHLGAQSAHEELSHIPGGEYIQWHVIAAPGHRFLEAVINTILRNIANYDARNDGVGKKAVLKLSGPIPYTLAINPLLPLYKHRFLDQNANGLRYKAVGSHQTMFKHHYSKLDLPLIL